MDRGWRAFGLILGMAVLACTAAMPETARAIQAQAVTSPAPATPPSLMESAPPSPTPRGPGPLLPRTFPGLLHLVDGHWVRTRVVHLNEPLRFSILVQDRVPGWSHLRLHLRIRRTFIGGAHGIRQFDPRHIFRVGMKPVSDKGGYTRYAVTVRFRTRGMLGVLLAEFHVSNGMGYMGTDLLFTVRT